MDSYIEMDLRSFSLSEMRLAGMIFEKKILKFGTFKLSHKGFLPCPYYLELGTIALKPKAMREIANVYESLVKGIRFDYYAAVPSAVSGLSYILTLETGIPSLPLVKTEQGPRILANKAFSDCNQDKKVLIFDDVVTSGESAIKVKDLLEDLGFKVEHFVFFLDREQGGRRIIEEAGYKVKYKFKISRLLNFYFYREKMISELEYKNSMDYIKNNQI